MSANERYFPALAPLAVCQALNKNQGEERVMDEAFDLLCVAWRFCRMDWKKKEE